MSMCVLHLYCPIILFTVVLYGAIFAKGLSDELQKLQISASRMVTLSGYEDCSSDLLNELDWEKLEIKISAAGCCDVRSPQALPTLLKADFY